MFYKDQRVFVQAEDGRILLGKVNYQRLNQNNEPEAVSVFLDEKMEACNHPPFPSYSGTMFPAEKVSSEDSEK